MKCKPHKYHKVNLGYADVWACANPHCSHYMPKHMEDTVEGKFSVCWGCGEKFTLDSDALALNKPMCFDCRNGVARTTVDEPPLSDTLAEYLKKLEV